MPQKNIKIEKPKESTGGYSPIDEELKVWQWYQTRKAMLIQARANVNGEDMTAIWQEADDLYEKNKSDKEESVEDQSELAMRQAFMKVNVAQSNLIDRNPILVLTAQNDRYKKNTQLLKSLAQSSWDKSGSFQQVKNFVHNQCRYGFAAGRTYHRVEKKIARFRKELDETGKETIEERELISYDEIYFKNLSPFNVWLDEQTIPGDIHSTRDWMWREVWDLDDLREKYSDKDYPNMKFVSPGGNTSKREDTGDSEDVKVGGEFITPTKSGDIITDNKVEVRFYENQAKDWLICEANGVMIVWEMLPQDKKNLSLTYTWFNLRNDHTPYGIGIPEILKNDDKMIEKINNMTAAGIKAALNVKGFYEGTEDWEGQTIKLKPNEFRRKTPGTKIDYIQAPYPNLGQINQFLSYQQDKIDNNTGIQKPIMGEITGKTLGEVGIAREASLKRLRTPLGNIKWALDIEFKNRIDLIKQVYSVPKVERLVDKKEIDEYLDEIGFDNKFYFLDKGNELYTNRYREENLKLSEENGVYSESEEDKFFRITPEGLIWEGDVNVKLDSILMVSEELLKNNKMQLGELMIKVLPFVAQSPELLKKTLTNIIKANDEEPDDWLPESLLEDTPMNRAELINKTGANEPEQQQNVLPSPTGQNIGSELSQPGQKLGQAMSQPFRT